MKYTYFGFSQAVAIELGLDLVDLAILRYFIDFKDSGSMAIEIVDGEPYYWVKYENFRLSNPILGVNSNRALARRLKKLIDVQVLKKYIKKSNGTYTFYSVGKRYIELLDSKFKEPLDFKVHPTGQNSPVALDSKVQPKDSSINNSSINNIYTAYLESNIIQHKKITDSMKRKITAALKDYTEEEIIQSIRNYGAIVNDEKYYFNHKWTLVDFLSRGLENFIDFNVAHNNYLSNSKKGGVKNEYSKGAIEDKGKNIHSKVSELRRSTTETETIDF